jgi:antitoxin component YwqK of YwqJK toxin-antitoxin module
MTNLRGPRAHQRSPFGWHSTLALALGGLGISGLLGAATGCGSSQTPAPVMPTAGSNIVAAPQVDRSRCKAEGKQVTTADTNMDGKPDVWKYYVPNGQGAQVLTCKQVDLNHDGRVDIVSYFDDTGTRTNLEEFDVDLDGRIDETVYYANGKKIRSEFDTNYDGKSDVWNFYEDEKLVRIERDTDNNGRVDQWEYYEGGKLDRIGYDTTGAGKVDKWDRAPDGGDAAPASPAPGASPAAGTAPAATAAAGPAPTAPKK